jgi:K+ transporter
MLLLGLPLFVACIIPTALMFIVPALLIKRFIKDQMFHSSINLGATAFITYPICCIIPSIVMICTGGWLRGLIYFALFPLMFIYAWNYVRWVTKAMGHRRFVLPRNRQRVEQLRALRSQIFGDLDEVLKKGTTVAE